MAFQKALHRVRPFAGSTPVFLRWYMEYLANTSAMHTLATGSTIKHLPQVRLRQLPVPLPPLAEQRRITTTIEEHLSQLDRARSSLLTGRARIPQAIASTRSDLLALPGVKCSCWSPGVLGDLLERIEAGRSYGGAAGPASGDEWGIVKVSAMTWGRFIETENKHVPDAAADPAYEIHEGDILVSRANTEAYVGAPVLVGRVRPRLLLSDKSLRLVPKPGVVRQWLLHVLASPTVRRYISKVATGTKHSMRNISQAMLLQAPVEIPPANEQERLADEINDRLAAFARLDSALVDALGRGELLRRSILADAFAGRLVPQDVADEPASVLLERVRAERAAQPARTRQAARGIPS